MADKTSITFLCDSGLKRDATEIFSRIGLSMTAGLEVYLRAVVREGGIPFPLKDVMGPRKEGVNEHE